MVLGAGGQVGRAVVATCREPHRLIIKTRADLDICDSAALRHALDAARPEWIVNAAAYTAVDSAEDERAAAGAINDTGAGIIADAAASYGARLVHLSTDFVFDGASNRAYLPQDVPRPLGVYGESKLGGERRVLAAGGDPIVLRTAWVYAAAGRNFVLTMLKLMREREQVSVVADQIGAPTWATGLARAIWDLLEAGAPGGIHHWTDLGVASWYDFAVAIQDEALSAGLLGRRAAILPIATAGYPTRARRPAFSVLDTTATRSLVATPAVHWRHNLRTLLNELRTS